MSALDSLPEGYEYCDCHPETCCHFDGIRKKRDYVFESNNDNIEFLEKIAVEDKEYPTTNIWHKKIPLQSAINIIKQLEKDIADMKNGY
jgi:hypothetical protein